MWLYYLVLVLTMNFSKYHFALQDVDNKTQILSNNFMITYKL